MLRRILKTQLGGYFELPLGFYLMKLLNATEFTNIPIPIHSKEAKEGGGKTLLITIRHTVKQPASK